MELAELAELRTDRGGLNQDRTANSWRWMGWIQEANGIRSNRKCPETRQDSESCHALSSKSSVKYSEEFVFYKCFKVTKVEVRGVEPLSEKPFNQTSTCVVDLLI